jgi:hypothetical protein
MRSRLAIVIIALAACLGSAAVPAHSQTPPVNWPDKTHLVGLVSDVIGPDGDPTSFVLQLGTMSVQIGTVPRTRFVARSLEAQVEKFVAGDYALVLTRRTKEAFVAVRITYDVQPFPPLRALNGMITWVSADQMRFRLRLDPSGRIVPIRVRPQVRFQLDGRAADTIPTLLRGQTVQVLALQHNGLDAYEIDLTRSGLDYARGSQ